ncbi:MAG: GNAT family N-acetyltransferase [Candidatus Abyssobacteria bacterium SURF_5]|uniref:GNAT family N-acetyltransferase n=1 Tax=Abyssobacteria bacterium (strain SURF_5) TaxID=2093360 RepID=A0A3A4P1N0_ABYX5|nr:MAG: GNAT family N-acetyltransferase [Candidatus Abyssubacteria bacterium SURF_5]
MEGGEVVIREAVKADVPAIVELMKALTLTTSRAESDPNAPSPDYQKSFDHIKADPNRKLFVAVANNQVVGAVDLLIAPNLSHHALPWAIVENLVVAGHSRQRGIGRKLVEHLIRVARQSGCYKIGLSSDKRRTEAHRLYKSLGFDQYGLGFRIYF